MNQLRKLTLEEKRDLQRTLSSSEKISMLIHGEGEFRQISFYADGTRRETRIDYPDVG